MVNRWSVVLLIVGVMAGYAITGTTLRAQERHPSRLATPSPYGLERLGAAITGISSYAT